MPNNPALRTLSWEQKNWILANIEFDLKQEAAAFNGGSKEMTEEELKEFKEVSNKMKGLAEEQRKKRAEDKKRAEEEKLNAS